MLVGNRYSDNRIYRGVRFYDKMPMLSEDMHEYSDTVFMKNAYIMNNIIGYGSLNSPILSVSSSGISLVDPAIVLIDGDISLVKSDDNANLVSIESISSAGYTSGVVCIIGWYQHITAQSTMRNYGGVDNSIINNNLLNETFRVQVSTRYQFRWFPVLVDRASLDSGSITINIADRDNTGAIKNTTSTITNKDRVDDVFIATAPVSMQEYALSDLYIVPLVNYTYDKSKSLVEATSRPPIKSKGTSEFINSETEPAGEYSDGTTWYNPITKEFRTYVSGVGFVGTSTPMGFLQYQSVHIMDSTIRDPQNITIPVDISELLESDVLQVSYEGLSLIQGEHYTVDYVNHTITLLDFTSESGDKVGFTLTKIVEVSDITNITTTFLQHMATTGSSTVEAHVKLSDSIDPKLGQGNGVAATPKAVYDATLVKDTTSGVNYKFGVANGLLYLEEV